MDEVLELKNLFDTYSGLSKTGKGMLVSYGQGLRTMEEMLRKEDRAEDERKETLEEDFPKKKGGTA